MMPANKSGDGRPPYQPFQCVVCQSRFTRHENLKRHAAVHSRGEDEPSLSCNLCNTTFSRADLRSRHMKRKHPEHQDKQPARRPNAARRRTVDKTAPGPAPTSVSPPSPNSDDQRDEAVEGDSGWQMDFSMDQSSQNAQNVTSQLTQHDAMTDSAFISQIVRGGDFDSSMFGATYLGSPGALPGPHADFFGTNTATFDPIIPDQDSPNRSLNLDLQQLQEGWQPSASQVTQGLELFFNHVSHFVPFLHRPTIHTKPIAPHLLLSILCLGYQYGEDPECNSEAGSGSALSERCYRQARALMAADEEENSELRQSTQYVTTVQACLLLQIYVMMYTCGKGSSYGLKTHSKMISLARAGGLMQPICTETETTKDLDSLWLEFVKAESHKRTLFAVHQIGSLWYQFLSVPRQLSHLEIKHDLPCPEDHWVAPTSTDWAHRQLVSRSSGSSTMRYSDAIRRFISSNHSGLDDIPPFDPYGAINITQFLTSSAREISGWSTMTGMISMERLEPLRASLLTLGPFIRSQDDSIPSPHMALCEATWETAMIEVQMWSPSHTGGIVEGSIDAVLHQLTYLAPSCEIVCEPNTAKAIQPHVDWFLQYLDMMAVVESEAPWITLYAYKAFMLAWQMVRGEVANAMGVVGVADGDAAGALNWARKVFQRRQRWQLGKIILSCLDTLEG